LPAILFVRHRVFCSVAADFRPESGQIPLQPPFGLAEYKTVLPKAIMVLGAALAIPSSGLALGIRLFDHDAFATARGDAFAATADNPSAIYYNPAGITQLRGHNVRGGVNVINVQAGFESLSRNADAKSEFVPVPGFFYTYSPERLPLSFGIGYYMPFGLSLKWPDDGPFRNTTTHGVIRDHTVSAVMAWKVTRTLSIAAGPAASYAYTDLRRGAVGDEFRFRGDAVALGATAGLLWQPTLRHSFGVTYRSPVTFDLEGKSTVTGLPVPKQNASVRLPLPQVIVGGYSFRPTPQWNLEVNLDWTDWERLNTPVLKQTPAMPLPLNWDSSFGVEAGVTRYFENGLRVSAGYMFLENSAPEKTFNPLVPDQDMHVCSVGVGGKIDRWSWDFTYQFTHGTGRDVSKTVYAMADPGVRGHYTFLAHAFSLSLGYSF
jgi:long-chain fatty acid transport protein